ncbi:KpsF/GutQ family sugar-phosphate isomerase [Sphingobium sp. AS12]|uniref:KpsF/GutQ family sugar-phosphate isomerase n=1 Tax=Sphingobium sp. AS12 TaxID=2849495 RepID=UPI001C3147EF|nr:KpsF/GutQ family sugar-phosphate isomerase [Sphingobium sp. AS12]MBV2149992.1 KpsF/GutQ family sugar-phosphate isomerase [Sphingobium sp. AS12]
MSDSTTFPSLAYSAGPDRVVAMGRAVIAAEAEALWALGNELGPSFSHAIATLQQIRGSVCVCGLGKSGHIARKIASTLAATGTPSLFLHAGEAVHGDLGMLRENDALLILSNSGSTLELGTIVRHAGLLDIPIVAITSSLASRLADAAEICLLLADRPEACPHGSAPTTSASMMLALGDALAITLMKLKGTTAEDLLRLHPGGRLGLDLVTVESFMHRGDELPFVGPGDPMRSVIATIGDKGFGVAAVVDEDGKLKGVITDGDIRRHVGALGAAIASEVMTRDPHVLLEGMLARDALEILSRSRITSLLVMDAETERRVVGLVHIHDLLQLGIG